MAFVGSSMAINFDDFSDDCEADALFGKRADVDSAHDRYANLETNFLLARIEEFEGLVLIAANTRESIDPAFLRRLHCVIEFRLPRGAMPED